jgi:hypothetical protein
MSKFRFVFLSLIFCSTAFAEPVLFVCERPAWEGKEGCGPNNTYYTYNLFVETNDFDKEFPLDRHPVYDFQMSKSCDASKATMWSYNYKVTDETIEFMLNLVPNGAVKARFLSTITLNRETMKAVMTKVKHSTELTCRKEKGADRKPGSSPSREGIKVD